MTRRGISFVFIAVNRAITVLLTSFFGLLSRGHGRLSTSPAPWRRGALLLPLRGPPGFWFPPKKIGPAGTTSFLVPPENAELGLGSRCHLPLGAPRESRAEKGD